MSLLMDALKKAEQDKKEAAKRQQKVAASVAESERLDDTDTWGREIVDGSSTAEIPGAESREHTDTHSTTAELQLEPISHADDTAEIPTSAVAAASSGAEDPTLNVTMNELSLAELSNDRFDLDDAVPRGTSRRSMAELQSESADLLDETFHGIALDKNDINPELFQETVKGDAYFAAGDASQTYGETLPGIPAAQLARDIGSRDQPTPVAAQTVFTASGTTQSSGAGLKWLIGGLASLALVAGVVWYYLTITPTNRALVSPQIAQGIEQLGPPLVETLDLKIVPETSPSSIEQAAARSAENLAGTVAAEQEVSAAPVVAEPGVTAIETAPKAVDLEQVEAAIAKNMISASTPAVAGADRGAARLDSLPEDITLETAMIRISRSKSADQRGQAVLDAFSAFQNGDHERAITKYEEALQVFPDNRDALLGLGAIAAARGDYESALRFYARVLRKNPADSHARAALINLQDRSVLPGSESIVNTMLHDSPDTHFLHFTLGNVYAAGSRWAEAQQAFFDAYRLNSGNPDYALNLAISLDHIGQYAAALDYYTTALKLAGSTPAGFDSTPVKKRIADLVKVAGH